jgi:D-amino-acid dehydrogenase
MENAKTMFPELDTRDYKLWMGFRPSTPDSLPILGEAPGRPGLYFMFGHGHFGMTGSPPSGKLVSQMITGASTGIDPAPYSPNRFTK